MHYLLVLYINTLLTTYNKSPLSPILGNGLNSFNYVDFFSFLPMINLVFDNTNTKCSTKDQLHPESIKEHKYNGTGSIPNYSTVHYTTVIVHYTTVYYITAHYITV